MNHSGVERFHLEGSIWYIDEIAHDRNHRGVVKQAINVDGGSSMQGIKSFESVNLAFVFKETIVCDGFNKNQRSLAIAFLKQR